jgi:hypothetical protein
MNPTVAEIVRSYLEHSGFDGLQCDGECSCLIDHLAPCGGLKPHCTAGFKHVPGKSNSEYDFYIVEDINDCPED